MKRILLVLWLVALIVLLMNVTLRALAAQQPPTAPGGPDTVATFSGIATVFTGDPAGGLVLEAYISEGPATTLCGRATVELDGAYTIDVAAASLYLGCGRAGDTVRFWLGPGSSLALGARASAIRGLPATPTGTFQPA